MNEEDVIYTQWNITQPSKRMNNAICSNMDGSRDDHTKQSQKEKDNAIWYPLCVESKIWHRLTYEIETDSQT